VSIPEHVVIVGGSVAGTRTAQALRQQGFDGTLSVIEPETGEAYDRPPLSKQYLSGQWDREQISLIPGGWASIDAKIHQGWAAALDTKTKRLELSTGEALEYDTLVIATGLAPRRLLADDGKPIGHVIATAADADGLREALSCGGHVVAVGGSYIAAETASAAIERGLTTSIINRQPQLLGRSLGPVVGAHVTKTHHEHGVDVRNNTRITSITRDGETAVLRVIGEDTGLKDTIRADVLVSGIGSTPNTDWLAGSGIRVDDGVATDARCRAFGAKDVYALGDVARFYDVHSATGRRVGHWTNAADQASIVAHNIMNPESPEGYREYPYFWSDQFGKKIQVAGRPDGDAHVEFVTFDGPTPRTVAVFSRGEEDECEAVVTFGWPRGMVAARRLMPLDPTSAEMLEELEKIATGALPSASLLLPS
jgi:3-phenylpropionate/trans-cinnamate dioxygenase ferredoxin reductase subunit